MLRIKKTTVVKSVLLFSLTAYTLLANQALAIDIAIPLSSSDPLIQTAVTQVVSDAGVLTMKNDMRSQVIIDQAAARPMQGVMEPLMQVSMQEQIKAQVMPLTIASLSDPTNPNGMPSMFAPAPFL